MDEIDGMLERMRRVSVGRSMVGDAGFVGRLEASARRGDALALARSTAAGLAIAAAVVIANPVPAAALDGGGTLLAVADGTIL